MFTHHTCILPQCKSHMHNESTPTLAHDLTVLGFSGHHASCTNMPLLHGLPPLQILNPTCDHTSPLSECVKLLHPVPYLTRPPLLLYKYHVRPREPYRSSERVRDGFQLWVRTATARSRVGVLAGGKKTMGRFLGGLWVA